MTDSTQDVQRAVKDYGALAVDIRGLVNENRPALQQLPRRHPIPAAIPFGGADPHSNPTYR